MNRYYARHAPFRLHGKFVVIDRNTGKSVFGFFNAKQARQKRDELNSKEERLKDDEY